MKKTLLIAATLLAHHAFSQTIPNGGFETWAMSGPFFAPTGWAVSPTVHQSPMAHSGSWAMMCVTDTFTNVATSTLDTITGFAYSGAATMGPPIPGAPLNGFAFTAHPDSLTGFYKYRAMGSDTLTITATLSKWNTTTLHRDVVATGVFAYAISDSVYKRFSVPMTYTTIPTPDTCVITISCANQQAPKHMGTTAWADDLAFIYLSTGVQDLSSYLNAQAYPNPFTNTLNITPPAGTQLQSAQLINTTGQVVARSTSSVINTSALPTGTYLLQTLYTNGTTITQKVIKQ